MEPSELFLLNHGRLYATGCYLSDDRLLVRAGSVCINRSTYRDSEHRHRRQELVNEGVLIKMDTGEYEFTRDHVFPAPSAASNVVLGQNSNGWTVWKNSDGVSLKILRGEAPLPAAKKLVQPKSHPRKRKGKIRWISPLMKITPEQAARDDEHQRRELERELASVADIRPGTSQNAKMARRVAQAYFELQWVSALSPEEAAANIKRERLVEFGLRSPTWLMKFAEAVEARRAIETPDAVPWNAGVSIAMMKADEESDSHEEITSEKMLKDRDRKVLDWLRKQSEPQTTRQMSSGTGMSETTVKGARRNLEAAGFVSRTEVGRGIPAYSAVVVPLSASQ